METAVHNSPRVPHKQNTGSTAYFDIESNHGESY